MDITTALALLKARMGITTDVRDTYLIAIINGILEELQSEKGLAIDVANPYHLMFVVDYATWRYRSVSETTQRVERAKPSPMPRHLQFRLNNLVIHAGGGSRDL